jgi:hypothetical protein
MTRPIRLAFVGQSMYFEACSLGPHSTDIESTFIDFRRGEDADRLLASLLDTKPDVAVFFKPESVPAGLLDELDALTVGFATEPLGSSSSRGNADLERRLAEFGRIDPGNFDRIISYNALMVPAIETVAPVWRSIPLPVADRYFRDVRPAYQRPRVIFVGRSTPHREALLSAGKHRYDLVHIAHGVSADDLEEIADGYDVGLNLHNDAYPNFENRASFHLAAGHLLLSEPLTPTAGLEPGIDYVEIDSRDTLKRRLGEIFESPDLYHSIRVRGRDKAELFRASKVYPSLVDDLLHDLEVFGSHRTRTRATSV